MGAFALTGLEGKVAVVTGAGRMRSIGRPIAVELARAGCDVVLTGTGRAPEHYPDDEEHRAYRREWNTRSAKRWIEYPYSQTMFASWQAGASWDAPTLEARGADVAVHARRIVGHDRDEGRVEDLAEGHAGLLELLVRDDGLDRGFVANDDDALAGEVQ